MGFRFVNTITLLIFVSSLMVGIVAIGADLGKVGANSGATITPNLSASARADAIAQQDRLQKLDTQLKVLNAQNVLIKDYQASILETVYWSLGTAVGLLLVIAGGTWYTNYKVFDTEQKRLKDELEVKQEAVKEEISVSLLETTSKLEGRLATSEINISKMIDERLEAHSARLTREVDFLKDHLNISIDDITKQIAKLQDQVRLLLESDKLNWQMINRNESSLRQVEEYVWELKDVPANILLTQTQGLNSAITAGDNNYVKVILERMKTTIKKVLDSGIPMSEGAIEAINDGLAKAEAIQPIEASVVRSMLKNIPINND